MKECIGQSVINLIASDGQINVTESVKCLERVAMTEAESQDLRTLEKDDLEFDMKDKDNLIVDTRRPLFQTNQVTKNLVWSPELEREFITLYIQSKNLGSTKNFLIKKYFKDANLFEHSKLKSLLQKMLRFSLNKAKKQAKFEQLLFDKRLRGILTSPLALQLRVQLMRYLLEQSSVVLSRITQLFLEFINLTEFSKNKKK